MTSAVLAHVRALADWVRRRPAVPEGAASVPYVGTISVLLWAFVIVSVVETVVLHVILPWHWVRLGVDVLSVAGVVWMLAVLAVNHTRPHLLSERALTLRSGSRTQLDVPRDQLAAVAYKERSLESGRSVQHADGVLSLAVAKRTNVDVRLVAPISHQGREVHEVRFLCDEPKALVSAADPGRS